jgi:hypothetical protein
MDAEALTFKIKLSKMVLIKNLLIKGVVDGVYTLQKTQIFAIMETTFAYMKMDLEVFFYALLHLEGRIVVKKNYILRI